MTPTADPNEDNFHFWVFHSRPKRIWEKILNVNGEGYIGTDNYYVFKIRKDFKNGRIKKNVKSNSWRE